MEAKQIKALIDAMASSDLTELEAARTAGRSGSSGDAADASAARGSTDGSPSSQRPLTRQSTPATADVPGSDVRAPLYGLVYLSPSPERSAVRRLGQAVKTGDTLCVIEAMKVFNNVCAEQRRRRRSRAGRVRRRGRGRPTAHAHCSDGTDVPNPS